MEKKKNQSSVENVRRIRMSYIDLNKVLSLNGTQLENYNFTIMLGNEKFAKKVSKLIGENSNCFEVSQRFYKMSMTDVISSIVLRGEITKEHICVLIKFLFKDYRRVSSMVRNFLVSNSVEGVWYE
jgi:hypothetical protein